MRLYELLAGKYVSVCKACGNLGGSGGMFPREILILDLLLDVIWWNLGLFLREHKLPFIVSLKVLQRVELIYMRNRILSISKGGGKPKPRGGQMPTPPERNPVT